MIQLSQTTQQNASASEELAATSEEMSAQAEKLQHLMAFFKVDMGAAIASTHTPAKTASRSPVADSRLKKTRGTAINESEFVRF